MRLLVSVRSTAEAVSALAGGADIIDAKEPASGPFGAVSPAVLRAILDALPAETWVGVALGDLTDPGAAEAAIARLGLEPRPGPLFFKIGFAGLTTAGPIEEVLRRAVKTAGTLRTPAAVVAAAYADHHAARSASPAVISDAAVAAGAGGVLIDTWEKAGRTLFDHLSVGELRAWVMRVRSAGLLTALAGSLGPDSFPALAEAAPDVAGVRGAACRGGRSGVLEVERVRRLRALLVPEPLPRGAGAA